jgi:hypothetical protein
MRQQLVVAIVCACSLASRAESTPVPANWHREVLIGEDEDSYYQFLTRSLHPGTYYAFRQTLALQRISKGDFSVIEEIPLRDVHYYMDMTTEEWHAEETQIPPFDLGDYLRRRGIHLAFAESSPPDLRVGAAGVYLETEGVREIVLAPNELLAQVAELGGSPRIAVIQETRRPVRKGEARFRFYTVYSNLASTDVDWSEDLLMIEQSRLLDARRRIREKASR